LQAGTFVGTSTSSSVGDEMHLKCFIEGSLHIMAVQHKQFSSLMVVLMLQGILKGMLIDSNFLGTMLVTNTMLVVNAVTVELDNTT
jgi:hypothetical protein